MRKKPAQQDVRAYMRLKEGLFILLATVASFFLLALATHSNSDPSWSRIGYVGDVVNLAGTWGAWTSDVALYFLGFVAYFIPIGFLLLAARFLRTREWEANKAIWALRFGGFIVTLLSACALAELHLPYLKGYLPSTPGGIVGFELIGLSLPILNLVGAQLLFVAFLLIGLTLTTGISWIKLSEITGTYAVMFLRFAYKNILSLYGHTKTGTVSLSKKLYVSIREKAKQKDKALSIAAKIAPTTSYRKDKALNNTSSDLAVIAPVKSAPAIIEAVEEIDTITNKAVKPVTIKKRGDTALAKKKKAKVVIHNMPPVDLLELEASNSNIEHFSEEDLKMLAQNIETKLNDFGVAATVEGIYPGPIITRFEISLGAGVKVSKITTLSKDLARSLLVTSVRVVEIIPGKSFIGLEIPNKEREIVSFADVIRSEEYQNPKIKIPLVLGKDISGAPVVADLAKMPHLLVAGTTGSGKSVGINAMLLSMLYAKAPEDLRLILIDPKMLELSVYEGVPHLLAPVVTDMNEAANALRWCVVEMERRYELMAGLGVRNLVGFNDKITKAQEAGKPLLDPTWQGNPAEAPLLEKLPFIVVIIDEFADMMMVVGKKVEELIARIAQKARAAGIHMVLATQRPSVDVITGLIKANVPTRISFQVSSKIDSRTILDQQGAEQLLGSGDMLFLPPGTGIPMRVHGAFVDDINVHNVVQYFKELYPDHEYELNSPSSQQFNSFSQFGEEQSSSSNQYDELYDQAVQIVMESGKTSSSYLQRRLKIGYNRAARLVECMEQEGILSSVQANGAREILVNKEQY